MPLFWSEFLYWNHFGTKLLCGKRVLLEVGGEVFFRRDMGLGELLGAVMDGVIEIDCFVQIVGGRKNLPSLLEVGGIDYLHEGLDILAAHLSHIIYTIY